MVESMGKIKFVSRGGSSVKALVEEDLGYQPGNQEIINFIESMQKEPFTVEQRVSVRYFDENNSAQPGIQYDSRSTVDYGSSTIVNLPLCLTGGEALEIANILLYDLWLNKRTAKLNLSLEHIDLEPTDVITVTVSEMTYVLRIINMSLRAYNSVEIECVIENSALYSIEREGEGTFADVDETGYLNVAEYPTPILLDIPILDSRHNDYGFYVGFASDIPASLMNMPTPQLWVSADRGESFHRLWDGTEKLPTIKGYVLPDYGGLGGSVSPTVIDYKNTVTVLITGDTPQSTSENSWWAGANTALIGNEIIAYKTVTQIDTNVYELSELKRGLFGTENMIDDHEDDERFVLLVDHRAIPRVHRVIQENYDPTIKIYKMTALGDDPSLAAHASEFMNQSKGRLSYGVGRASWERTHTTTWKISWRRRSKFRGEWWDQREVPLFMEAEKYHIVFMDNNGNELRIVEKENPGPSPWILCRYDYTAEKGKEDYGYQFLFNMQIPGNKFNAVIYQILEERRGPGVTIELET